MAETQVRQLEWRHRQIASVKLSAEYIRYTESLPRNRRDRSHPVTPNASDLTKSKRAFEGRLREWRSALRTITADRNVPLVYFFIQDSERHDFLKPDEYPGVGIVTVESGRSGNDS